MDGGRTGGGWKLLTNADEIAPIGGGPQPILRRPHRADASDVLDAFRSNPDMARQGTVTDGAEAERYLGRLLDDDSTHEPWGIALDGRLELGHRVNNPTSGAVARCAGFRKEGTERGKFLINGERIDVDIYGRLRADPFPTFEPISKLTTSVISSSARSG